MKLVGLTGTTGSGKGYVSGLFAQRGIDSIDTDAIVHSLYREDHHCIAELEAEFGPIRGEDGSVNRKQLASIVFANESKLARLNAIVHRLVRQRVEEICLVREQEGCEFLLLDAPLLYEAGMVDICYRVIAVVAPQQIRLQRICARDGLTVEQAEQRMKHQHTDAFFAEKADYVICNDGQAIVEEWVDRIIGELKNG
ncbi:MAG: dephospho-CoA kinase [Clostridia bacterium]|nr:dephospho-CoA kinase [Clostridia bacterium]